MTVAEAVKKPQPTKKQIEDAKLTVMQHRARDQLRQRLLDGEQVKPELLYEIDVLDEAVRDSVERPRSLGKLLPER